MPAASPTRAHGSPRTFLAVEKILHSFLVIEKRRARALPESWDAALVAVQPGVENVLAARSVLP